MSPAPLGNAMVVCSWYKSLETKFKCVFATYFAKPSPEVLEYASQFEIKEFLRCYLAEVLCGHMQTTPYAANGLKPRK